MNHNYYYFSTHTIYPQIYTRLAAFATSKKFDVETKDLLDEFVNNFTKITNQQINPLDYCSRFIMQYKDELYELYKLTNTTPKQFLLDYLGYSLQWKASTRSFGKNCKLKAHKITEQELIQDMIDPKASIKKLLDASGGDLSAVKPFLPAIMISLWTNTRDKSKMTYKHTGKFCFDFDKFTDKKEAIYWMKKVWSFKNINPYFGFISPRSKGFKIFCQVDISSPDFKADFGSEDNEVVKKHHKFWYDGAMKEIVSQFPELKDRIDPGTNDPTRLTYIPFISNNATDFKYDASRFTGYTKIVKNERKLEREKLLKKISENQVEVGKIMKEQNITCQEEAYNLFLKKKSYNFDLEFEKDKFIKVIDFIEEQTHKDSRIESWVSEEFNTYASLQKLSWVLYGVFGDVAIEQIKRLIPVDSNKLDENHNDYRWAIRSMDDYDVEVLKSLTPAPFYARARKLPIVNDFISENFGASSQNLSDFKILNDYYETYIRNISLDDNTENLSEFLDDVTRYVDQKKVRLPLIEEFDNLTAEITLGPNDYLDKDVMHDLFQNKYSDKRIFFLRSQCGTGKNSITGNPNYKMPGRIFVGMPYRSIGDQIASDAWDNNNETENGVLFFVNSTAEDTIKGFKKTDKEPIKLNYLNTLNGAEIPKKKNLGIITTYNQILNIPHEDMATLDYVVIDESQTLTDGISYRKELVAKVMNYLIEFVAKKRNSNTKIIFMTGTPNIEALVIPELMEAQSMKDLFQIIKVDKQYKITPTMHLTHLDTNNATLRNETVITQIKKYLKHNRKVVHIFNNKEKIEDFRRELQFKISSDLKVGLFYSGSTGACTENILAGKFGEYDIVLATTCFMNGINIYLDGISKEENSKGITSTQKYGVVIDLGNLQKKVSALDAVQTINRFRNRLCHCTVFLPKIFKPDLRNPSRKFDLRNAGNVLLGINRDNHHLLSADENRVPNTIEEVSQKQQTPYLEEVRNNPNTVTTQMIEKRMQQSKNEQTVIDSFNKKISKYKDWFYSLDGYHYMAKDAGILSIIKHIDVSEPSKDISKQHLILENNIIRNFLNDEKALAYLENQLDPDKRIFVKASGVIKDPLSEYIGNFKVVAHLNNKYTVEGDFHVSHERALNKLIKYHLRLCYWYGKEKAIEILRYLINEEVDYAPIKVPSYLKSITNYCSPFSYLTKSKYLKGINYLRTLDYLSDKNIGVIKEVTSTSISYTFINNKIVTLLKKIWAKQQFDKIGYGIDEDKSIVFKDQLKNKFSDKELIKEEDLLDLEDQLDKLTSYRPMRINKNNEVRSHERIIIPRILRSNKFLSEMESLAVDAIAPEYSDLSDNNMEFTNFTDKILKRLDDRMDTSLRSSHAHLDTYYISLKEKLKKKDIQAMTEYIEGVLNDPKKNKLPEVSRILNALKKDLKELDHFLLTAFKTAEHMTYKNIHDHKTMPFIEQTFFCEKDFKLETLDDKFSPDLVNFKITDVYDSLFKHTDLFTKAKKIKIRTEKGREIINFLSKKTSNYTKPVHAVFDKKGNIIYANFDQMATCKFLCNYAFTNDRFKMKDGSIPVKTFNKGIYNPNTFKRDYYANSSKSKTISNYRLKIYDVNVKQYVNYVQSLNQKKAS